MSADGESPQAVEALPKLSVTVCRVPVYGAISIFAVLGCLIRIGLNRLFSITGGPFPAFLYAEILGCLIMGWAVKHKVQFSVGYYPLYPGISSGLCGSITTFGSWILQSIQAFLNLNATARGAFSSILAGLSVLILTALACSASLNAGAMLSRLVRARFPLRWKSPDLYIRSKGRLLAEGEVELDVGKPRWWGPVKDHRQSGIVGALNLFLTIAPILMMLVLTLVATLVDTGSNRSVVYACIFAPLGALVRYELSFYNSLKSSFPIGTFVANYFGTLIGGLMLILAYGAGSGDANATAPSLSIGSGVCALLKGGISDGFCGCLTTISTFFHELKVLTKRAAVIYGLCSVSLSVVSLLALVGTTYWSRPYSWVTCSL